MTPLQWAGIAREAAHDRDWAAFNRAMQELLAPTLRNCTPAQIAAHRIELARQLREVDARLATPDSLDPSDPDAP